MWCRKLLMTNVERLKIIHVTVPGTTSYINKTKKIINSKKMYYLTNSMPRYKRMKNTRYSMKMTFKIMLVFEKKKCRLYSRLPGTTDRYCGADLPSSYSLRLKQRVKASVLRLKANTTIF